MTDRLETIIKRHERDQEAYDTMKPKILKQMWDYSIHQDRGYLIDRVKELTEETK